MAERRSMYYGTIIYEESAEDWREKLIQTKIPTLVSPEHNKDVDAQGNLKKAHRHALFCFGSLKSPAQVREIVNEIGACGVEICHSPRGMALYLTHKGTLEKAQYSENDILCFNGADYKALVSTSNDRYQTLMEIFDFCRGHCITNYAMLIQYCRENNAEWFKVAVDCCYPVREYLRARTWSGEAVKVQNAVPTGRADLDSVENKAE